jgi:hypothetical protein
MGYVQASQKTSSLTHRPVSATRQCGTAYTAKVLSQWIKMGHPKNKWDIPHLHLQSIGISHIICFVMGYPISVTQPGETFMEAISHERELPSPSASARTTLNMSPNNFFPKLKMRKESYKSSVQVSVVSDSFWYARSQFHCRAVVITK